MGFGPCPRKKSQRKEQREGWRKETIQQAHQREKDRQGQKNFRKSTQGCQLGKWEKGRPYPHCSPVQGPNPPAAGSLPHFKNGHGPFLDRPLLGGGTRGLSSQPPARRVPLWLSRGRPEHHIQMKMGRQAGPQNGPWRPPYSAATSAPVSGGTRRLKSPRTA